MEVNVPHMLKAGEGWVHRSKKKTVSRLRKRSEVFLAYFSDISYEVVYCEGKGICTFLLAEIGT
jgi:hypothetical protein